MTIRAAHPRHEATRRHWRIAAMVIFCLACYGRPGLAAEASDGKALLETNCGRCHAVVAEAESPLKAAPNLWDVLGSYPGERLEIELGEGKGSRHPEMPQIQFSTEEIESIYYYLHGKAPDYIRSDEELGSEHP